MNSKKITIVIFSIILVIIVAICSVVNYNIINLKFKDPVVIEHSINEAIKGGATSLLVKGYNIIDGVELKTIVPDYKEAILNPDGSNLSNDQVRVLLVDVELINTTDENQSMTLAQIKAESLIWANGIPLDLFELLNTDKGNPLGVPLNPNEKLEVVVPYILYSVQFTKQDWADIENRMFNLSLSVYPTKHSIRLQ